MSEPPEVLLVGRVGKPHGLDGEVYVMPISDDPGRFSAGSELRHERAGALVVASARRHRNRLLVRFDGIATRSAAESLRGALYVEPGQLRELSPHEYWEHDLIGCTVVDRAGAEVGRVERIVAGAAQDLLAVGTARGDRLVPAVREFVVQVDVEARRIVIDPPAGLLE